MPAKYRDFHVSGRLSLNKLARLGPQASPDFKRQTGTPVAAYVNYKGSLSYGSSTREAIELPPIAESFTNRHQR
jgi:hypothetical protein